MHHFPPLQVLNSIILHVHDAVCVFVHYPYSKYASDFWLPWILLISMWLYKYLRMSLFTIMGYISRSIFTGSHGNFSFHCCFFWWTNILDFDMLQFICFFIVCDFGTISKHCQILCHDAFCLHFRVVSPICRSMIQFELTLAMMWHKRQLSQYSTFPRLWRQLSFSLTNEKNSEDWNAQSSVFILVIS